MPTVPRLKTWAGIIPSLHSPGVIMPGVLGPITTAPCCFARAITCTASFTGMCSVMITRVFSPASRASKAASAAKGAGTKTMEASASWFLNASSTVSWMGSLPWITCPPFPGVTPATIFVPYSIMSFVWNKPCFPVAP